MAQCVLRSNRQLRSLDILKDLCAVAALLLGVEVRTLLAGGHVQRLARLSALVTRLACLVLGRLLSASALLGRRLLAVLGTAAVLALARLGSLRGRRGSAIGTVAVTLGGLLEPGDVVRDSETDAVYKSRQVLLGIWRAWASLPGPMKALSSSS